MTDLQQRIMSRIKADCYGPFPLADVRSLRKWDQTNWDTLHGALCMYLAYVAGYAVSADRIARRPKDELEKARRYLAKGLFQRYPELAHYEEKITLESTPALYRVLQANEEVRKDLLLLFDEILSGS